MLTQELVEKIAPLFEGSAEGEIFSRNFRPAIKLIGVLSDSWENSVGRIAGIAEGTQANFPGIAGNIFSSISRTHSSISEVSSRKFFESYERLIAHLKSLAEMEMESVSMATLVSGLENFTELYDQFLSNPIPARAYPLLRQANSSWVQLIAVGGVLLSIYRQFQLDSHDQLASDAESSMSVYLTCQDNYSDLVLRLAAVGRLYSDLCRLLKVAEEDFPLKVIRIETGSLWIKVFGESKVLALAARFIESGASYIYTNFTTDGKISRVPRNVQALDHVLGLRASLREQGVDTEGMDQEIATASFHIAKSLNHLLQRQGAVSVNGRKLSVGSERLRQEIESRPWPLLEQIGVDAINEDGIERSIGD